jgi:uncharacterized protein
MTDKQEQISLSSRSLQVCSDGSLLEAKEKPAAMPVARAQRIPVLDVLRGISLLGILLLNIPEFSGPIELDNNPTLVGHHDQLNITVWIVRMLFFDGKMRAAFAMLFGAGVILFTQHAEARGLGSKVGDLFVRRNLWLMIFGMLHAYLIWYGDILYSYGLVALLFLYPFRSVRPRLLLAGGMLVLCLVQMRTFVHVIREYGQSNQITTQANEQQLKTKERTDDLKHMRSGYWEIVRFRAKLAKFLETDSLYLLGFADSLSMMLIGMALLQTGFLNGLLPDRVYAWTAAVCYVVSISVMGFGVYKTVNAHFAPATLHLYIWTSYQFVRLIGALANLSVIILAFKRNWFSLLVKRLAAVGQMALSNYVLTSVLCSLFFNGYGLGRYGQLEYYQLFYVVAVVWTVILVISPAWLSRFRFGPLEWLWRSLTYWKRQPMRLSRAAAAPSLTYADNHSSS